MYVINSYKLAHWLNVRKLTPVCVAERAGIAVEVIDDLIKGSAGSLPEEQATRLATVLRLDLQELAEDAPCVVDVIYQSRDQLLSSRRPLERDGIHFYNYYTLPSPIGHVGPVMLDILCPHDRLPQLNKGHLEPAITVNIGPGDIHGRWGEELDTLNWQVLEANRAEDDRWIVGDSYIEPAYVPHSYSLATSQPARIISYTCRSNLTPLFEHSNRWSDAAFDEMARHFSAARVSVATLLAHLNRHGYTVQTLAASLQLNEQSIAGFLAGTPEALPVSDLRLIGQFLGVDYRLLLQPQHRHDATGKTFCSVAGSKETVRTFKSYTVASMASAPQLPDLVGLFMVVDKPVNDGALDLLDHGSSHYLAGEGTLMVHWTAPDGVTRRQQLSYLDSLWVGPYVAHAFFGKGSLIKLGNGEGFNYLDQMEMSNTFNLPAVLRRGRKDRNSWTPLPNQGDRGTDK